MSQVRKFKDGGGTAAQTEQQSSTTEAKKKYKLIINGKEMLLDDDGLADFRKAGSGQGGMMGNVYADIADALQAGRTVSYNSDSNTISGVDFKRIDPTAIAKANENQVWDKKAQRRANRYARKNNLTHQFNSALASIGNINFYKPEDKSSDSSSSSSLTSLYATDPRKFDYNKGEDGKLVWSTGPQNAGNLTVLNNFIDMLGMSEDDAKKKYNWSGYDDQVRDLRAWYSRNQNYDWEGLRSRIRENQLTEDDWDVLRYMGFGENGSSNQDSANPNGPRSYEGSGFNNDALEQAGYYIKKGSDGNTYLYNNAGQIVRDSMYLRDTPWAAGTNWAGGAVYQGRLWTPDEIFNQNTVASQAIGSELFDRLSGITDPEQIRQAILNSPWKVSGTENPYSYSTFDSSKNYLKGFMDSLNTGTYYYNDISNKFNAPDDTHILAVMNGSNRDRDNILKTQYAVSGYSGLFDSIEQLQNYLNTRGITSAQGYRQTTPISQYNYITNNGKRYILAPEQIDIAGEKFNLYRDEEGNYYTDGDNNTMLKLEGTGILDAIKNGTITAQGLKSGQYGISPDSNFWKGFLNKKKKERIISLYGQNYTPGSYDQVFGFKKGGRIPIMQMGGYFSSGRAAQNKQGEQTDNRAGQPQNLGADKRLKTQTDTLNKTAGWLDAAGLATSWIPGVGTGVGILGSLARFGADVKKDGFQWKDAGNLAINLGLDALTLIPGLGAVGKVAKAGSKAAKLVKTSDKVAKVAKAVSPLMSAAGATAGAAQIAGALNNPDGMTSEDFGNLLSGIANVGLGSKNLIKNYKVAKVTKSLAGKKPIKTKDAFKIGDKDGWVKKSAKKVGNLGNRIIHAPGNALKGGSSTINYMLNPFKQSQIDELIGSNWKVLAKSPNQFHNQLAAEFLVKNPLSVKTRTINGKIYQGKQTNPFWMNPSYSLTSRKSVTKKSKIAKPESPIKTTEQVTFDQKVSELLSKINGVKTSADTRSLLKEVGSRYRNPDGSLGSNRFDDVLKARPDLREMIIQHVNNDRYYHGTGIDDFISHWNLKFKQGGKIVRAQSGTKMPFGTFITDNSSSDPNLYDYQRSGIQFNGSNVDWSKTYGNGTFMNYRQQYLNNWDNPAFKTVKDAYIAQLSQGNNNVDLTNFSKDDFARLTQDQKLGYAHNLWTDAFKNYLDSTTSTSSTNSLTQKRNLGLPEVTNPIQMPSKAIIQKPKSLMTSNNTNFGDGSLTGQIKQNHEFNGDPDAFIGLTEFGRSIFANNRLYGMLDDAIRKSNWLLQKPMPFEIYDRYQDHITPIYQEAANTKRQFMPTSTDAILNYTIRQQNEDAAQQLLTEGRLKASEAYSQYLDKNLAARRAYADQRRGVANQNREIMASTIMQRAQNKAANWLSNNMSTTNLIQEFRNKLAQDRQRLKGFQLQDAQVQAQNEYNRIFNEAGNAIMNEFNNLSEDEKQKYGGDWSYYWQSKDITGYNNALNQAITASQNIMRNFYPSQLDWLRYRPTQLTGSTSTSASRVRLSKKGGKTPTYLQRHNGPKPDEAIWNSKK